MLDEDTRLASHEFGHLCYDSIRHQVTKGSIKRTHQGGWRVWSNVLDHLPTLPDQTDNTRQIVVALASGLASGAAGERVAQCIADGKGPATTTLYMVTDWRRGDFWTDMASADKEQCLDLCAGITGLSDLLLDELQFLAPRLHAFYSQLGLPALRSIGRALHYLQIGDVIGFDLTEVHRHGLPVMHREMRTH